MSEPIGTILALHGLGLDGAAFRPVVDRLPEWRFMTPDLRGHGQAREVRPLTLAGMTDDIVSLIDGLGGEIHVLGHSMGGVIAGMAASRRPARVASLTLVATAPRGVETFAHRAAAAEAEGMASVVGETLERWFGHDPPLDPVVSASLASLAAMTVHEWSGCWRAFASFPGFTQLTWDEGLASSTLCLSTTADRSTPPPVVAEVAAAIPGSDHVSLDAGGHLGLLEHPDAFIPFLEQHWRANQPLHGRTTHD